MYIKEILDNDADTSIHSFFCGRLKTDNFHRLLFVGNSLKLLVSVFNQLFIKILTSTSCETFLIHLAFGCLKIAVIIV